LSPFILAPEYFLRGTDVSDACQQFIEIVPAAGPLQPVVVHGKPFNNELTQSLGGPDAKLGAPMGFYPVTDGNDDIEVVVLSDV